MPSSHPSSARAPAAHAADRAAASAIAPRSQSAHLSVSGISKSYGERRVLSDITFTASDGDRIGLVGENGSGKSTLLRIIAAEARSHGSTDADLTERADAGTISYAGSIGALRQELAYPDDATVGEILDDAQRTTRDALATLEASAAALTERPDDTVVTQAYADALEHADRVDAWAADVRRGETLEGLGLGGIPPAHTLGRLSGGQRLRLSLAALLLEAPHTLLLDEPSNHLDDDAIGYLERVLTAWRGIVVVASHDRALLDAVATRILDLDPSPVEASVLAEATADDPGAGLGARVWGVGYAAAHSERRAELARWRERYAAESAEHEALTHEIEIGAHEVNRKHESKSESRITRKFYADKDARVTSRRARSARVRLAQLERDRVRRPPEPLRFAGISPLLTTSPGPQTVDTTPGSIAGSNTGSIQDPAQHRHVPLPPAPLEAEGIAVSGRLAPSSLTVGKGDRILITGPNGSGKSTLLAALAGELQIDAGSRRIAPGARLGYLPQEVVFAQPGRTATEIYERAIGAESASMRPLAETGLLAARDLHRPIGTLSVGQRRRVALAVLVADPPSILLLDEPTNHLSLTLVEELEEVLREFTGSLVVATHDRWLRARWSGSVAPIAELAALSNPHAAN